MESPIYKNNDKPAWPDSFMAGHNQISVDFDDENKAD